MEFGSSISHHINPNASLAPEQQYLYQNPETIRKILNNNHSFADYRLTAK